MRYLWLCFVLLTSPVWAQEPWVTYPPSGTQVFLGLDDTSAPTQVRDGRAQDVQNVVLSISGSLKQRDGTALIITPSESGLVATDLLDIGGESFCAVTSLYYTRFSNGTDTIIATCGSRLYELNGTASWDRNAIEHFLTAGANNQLVWTVALDNMVGTNDVDAPIQYDGTTLSRVSFSGLTSPIEQAKTVIYFKNYLIFGNTVEAGAEHPTRFRWSNVGTINTWTDADFIDIGSLGGQEINCVAELYDTLVIGLSDSLYKISLVGGNDVFQVSKITDDIGCVAKNSIQSITLTNAQSGLVFLDKDKQVFFYNGVIAQDISQFITTTMSGLSGSRLQYAVSTDTGTRYLLCLTSGTASENNLCLDFQYELGEWTKHTNISANALAHVLDSNSDEQEYWGSYKSLVYQLEGTNLVDDVGTLSGLVDSVGTYTTVTESGLQVLFDESVSVTTGSLVGAPIRLSGGTGIGLTSIVADNTATGIIVTDAFDTTPDTTTAFEIGAINSYYTTKWYDMGQAARIKHFGEVFFWAKADASSTHSLAYATDFNADVSTLSLTLSASATDSIWGSAIWGTSLWGSVDTVFRQGKLETQGRYLRLKWSEDDPNEAFEIYGWIPVYRPGGL